MVGALVALLSTSPALVKAQSEDCIPLKGSSTCPAFQSASFSKNQDLTDSYSFLSYVKDTKSFDKQLSEYVKTTYIQNKYRDLFGCENIDLTDANDYYARFTTTIICNAIVQKSIEPCGLTSEQSIPLCAEACAQFAQSAAFLTSNKDLCANPAENLADLIRADFTTCHLPDEALSGGSCIDPADNESQDCGFGDSTLGLCQYCSEGGFNSTDTCCYNSNAEERCQDVELPSITSTLALETTTGSSSPTETSSQDESENGGGSGGGLSGGAIAGIVIGALAGVALVAALLFFCIRRAKSDNSSQKGSIFNQPSPSRKGPGSMVQTRQEAPQGYEVLPGGRIARMSALEGHSGDSSSQHRTKSGSALAAGAAAGYMAGHRKGSATQSSSEDFGDSPHSEPRAGVLRPPPAARRNGSLSSNSVFNSVPQSPISADGGFSSPQGLGSQQSEQLPFFKDYYSQDDIHPGDRVAVLWAYQPRATDEFALERGDMLKVVGIWDDGWATGVMIDERADDWETRRQQRDSGVSHASGRRGSSPAGSGEIKAFPLVCVCLPDHWRKTIEGDGSTEIGSNGNPGLPGQT